jgi:FtsZ-interacting cell division protein ZipA
MNQGSSSLAPVSTINVDGSSDAQDDGNGALVGGIIGGIIGAIVLLLLICCAVWLVRRRQNRRRLSESGGTAMERQDESDADEHAQAQQLVAQKSVPKSRLEDLTVAESRHGESVRAPPEPAEDEPEGDDDEYELVVPLTF